MKQMMMRSKYVLILFCGFFAHTYVQGVAFFPNEKLASSSDESETGFQTLHRHLEHGEYQLVEDLCKQQYADPANSNEWAIWYGFLGHAQIVLGQPEVGMEKIEKVIDNSKVDPIYRGWACKTAAYWMQIWGQDEAAEDYLQEAVSCGYTD